MRQPVLGFNSRKTPMARGVCDECGRDIMLRNRDGMTRVHRWLGKPCPGSGRAPRAHQPPAPSPREHARRTD